MDSREMHGQGSRSGYGRAVDGRSHLAVRCFDQQIRDIGDCKQSDVEVGGKDGDIAREGDWHCHCFVAC